MTPNPPFPCSWCVKDPLSCRDRDRHRWDYSTDNVCPGLVESPPKTLSVPEAAKALGVHRRTVLRRIASGTISAIEIPGRSGHEYRIRESEIEKYLKGSERDP